MDTNGLKQKMLKVMKDYMVTMYGDKYTAEDVLKELKPLWVALEDNQLIRPGMTFNVFVQHAESQAIFQNMKNMMGF